MSVVYHYTSHDAAYKILTGRYVRLSNILFMNDANEFWWFFNRVNEFLAREDAPGFVRNHVDSFVSRRGKRGVSMCGMCFSEDGDDASQWDRYARHGNGVVLGFDEDLLRAVDRTTYCEVRYSLEEQDKLIASTIREICELYPVGTPALGNVVDPLSRLAVFCKNPRFASERERRLAAFGVAYTSYQFHPRADTLLPFTTRVIPPNAVLEVRLGPTCLPEAEHAWNLVRAQLNNGRDDLPPGLSRSESGLR